jgi:hypothetical protein
MFIQLTTSEAPVRLPEEVVAVADHLMSQVAQLQQERQVELLQPPVRPAQVRLTYFFYPYQWIDLFIESSITLKNAFFIIVCYYVRRNR